MQVFHFLVNVHLKEYFSFLQPNLYLQHLEHCVINTDKTFDTFLLNEENTENLLTWNSIITKA